MADNLLEIRAGAGPGYDRWLSGLTDAVARLYGETQVPVTLGEHDEWAQPSLWDQAPV